MLRHNRLPGFDSALPSLDQERKVIWMDGVARSPILQFLRALTEIFQNLSVHKFDFALRIQCGNEPRNAVHDLAQALLVQPECILSALAVVNVAQQHLPALTTT